ncbi:TetR/AcrR family transcriptional regulator [Streptomyces sp. NPDC048376]|uniref:TetR/AcrR family transcriptional regulator n=1 Tax=unclassified Streptomyces TaxID=2593676 RepID=UPI003412F6FC
MKRTTSVAQPAPAKPTRVRTPNRRGEGGHLREEIIDAAVALLDETGGQHVVTLRSIARRVGIATPSIYLQFPDQPAVMLAALQREFAGLEAVLRAAVDQAGDDPRRRLLAVCETYLDFAVRHPQRYRTMFGGLWTPALGDNSPTGTDLARLGSASMLILVEVLDDCVAAGVVTSADVPADATALRAGLHGLAHQRIVSPSYPWPADIPERVILPLTGLNTIQPAHS